MYSYLSADLSVLPQATEKATSHENSLPSLEKHAALISLYTQYSINQF